MDEPSEAALELVDLIYDEDRLRRDSALLVDQFAARAVAEEREACARVADKFHGISAMAIRARGAKETGGE